MYKIFVDLEMHPIPRSLKEERKICTQEIIEIGAVKLNEENEEISSFCEFARTSPLRIRFPKSCPALSNGAAATTRSIPGATATSGRS